jgi:hypothetical protein
MEVARHPPKSAFDEVGDYLKSLGTGRFAAQLTEIVNCQFLSWKSAVPPDHFETGSRNAVVTELYETGGLLPMQQIQSLLGSVMTWTSE